MRFLPLQLGHAPLSSGDVAAPSRRTRKFGPRLVESLEGRELLSQGLHGVVHPLAAAPAQFYKETDLVSDVPGRAAATDPKLVNPWGLAAKPTNATAGGPFWVADNGKGVSTLYKGDGTAVPLVVTIPPPAGSPAGTTAAPTGIVYNGSSAFAIAGGPARFLFVTEDGTIAAWNATSGTKAVLVVDNSAKGAVYKGAALATDSNGATFLYAANFRNGKVEVYDTNFKLVNSFTDPRVARNYAPFGIENVGGALIVTFAQQNTAKHDDVRGRGHGFVVAFDANGRLLARIASRGGLNSPWGVAVAPANFGRVSGDLLVGNFGDGRINAFHPIINSRGRLVRYRADGQLTDAARKPIVVDGLWGLRFGNGSPSGGAANTLFFTAGINGEKNGLFGTLTAAI